MVVPVWRGRPVPASFASQYLVCLAPLLVLGASFLTVKELGIEVPYSPFATTGQGPRNADGWCFADRVYRNPTDTLKTSIAQMFICGGYVSLNYNEGTQRGDTLGVFQLDLEGEVGVLPAP